MSNKKIHIVVAGGGTGGHLFPGIAIARAFLEKDPNNQVLFIGTNRPFETETLARAGFTHRSVWVGGLKGLGLFKKIKTLFMLPVAVIQSLYMLWRFKADLIVGVGGYSSGPVVLAGFLLRKKIVLHEQNSIPGITNRLLSGLVHRIYVSFAETANHFSMTPIITTGNPVREEIKAVRPGRENDEDGFTVFVSGGSQGARSINAALIESLTYFHAQQDIYFIHQTGEADLERVKKAYDDCGIKSSVQSFFHDMDRQYGRSDLILCRAGATTLAEITAMGHRAILIPFPHAADDHQTKNAALLEQKNAARMIQESVLDGKIVADLISFYQKHPEACSEMGENAKKCGHPDAAQEIVANCYALLRR